jgi:hypothetical protein
MRTVDHTIAGYLSQDLLLAMFDAGVALGLGTAPEMAASAEMERLIAHIRARWFGELNAARAWQRADPALTSDAIPGWLLGQQQQADSVRERAAIERETALGDAQPPNSWIARTTKEGKP